MPRFVIPSIAALVAVLGAVVLLDSYPWRDAGSPGGGERSRGEFQSEPEIILRNVEMREVRKGEATNRLLSEQANYRVLSGDLSASGVTLVLPGLKEEVVLRAPEARWEMRAERILLPAGGTAESGGGWSAFVVAADLSLRERVLRAPGAARLTGPGLAIAGDNLVWHWQDGKVELERPKTRVFPARALGRKG